MYFALEYIEQQFLQAFTANLCEQVNITSLVYVHDGFYCAPAPTLSQLQHVTFLTTTQQKLPYFPLKYIDLAPLWHKLYGPLLSDHTFTPQTTATALLPHRAHAHTGQGLKRKACHLTDQQTQPSLDQYFKKKFRLTLNST